MAQLDQRDFRTRLYQNMPGEWFPDLEDAPNLAAILDMLSATWSSEQVVERTLAADLNGTSLTLDSTFAIAADSLVSGDGILGNPVVTRVNDATTLSISVPQLLSAGTRIIFNIPDQEDNGLIQLLQYTQNQARLQSATGFWLDLFAQDFFGNDLIRHHGESDDAYRRRITVNLLSPKATRCAVFCNVKNLTGFDPKIIEPRNTNDCGSYTDIDNPIWGGIAYGKAGAYGSMELPFQFFIKCTRPPGAGIPDVNGYSMSNAGYATIPQPFGLIGGQFSPDFGLGEYVQLSDIDNNNAITDDDIYSMVSRSLAAGVTAWTAISSDIQSELRSSGLLNLSFYLDMTALSDLPVQVGGFSVKGTFHLAAASVISHYAIQAKPQLRLAAASQLNVPVLSNVVASLGRFIATSGIDTSIAETKATITLQAVAQATSNANATVTGILPLKANAAINSNSNADITGQLHLVTSSKLVIAPAITITLIQANALAFNGDFGVTRLGIDFVLDTSILVPPGSKLGQSLLLGESQIGHNYGF